MERTSEKEYLTLTGRAHSLALPLEGIREILTEGIFGAVASRRPWMAGVLYYRKTVIPLVDLRGEASWPPKIAVVCELEGEALAFAGNGVSRTVTIPREMLKKPPKDGGISLILEGEALVIPTLEALKGRPS